MFGNTILFPSLTLLVHKFTSHRNLLFMMHFIYVRCLHFISLVPLKLFLSSFRPAFPPLTTGELIIPTGSSVPACVSFLSMPHLYSSLCHHISRHQLSYLYFSTLHCYISHQYLWSCTALYLYSCSYGMRNQSILPFQWFRVKRVEQLF